MKVIINKYTNIPVQKYYDFTNGFDNQTTYFIHVYEGEEEIADKNLFLGQFEISGFAPEPAKQAKLRVHF